MRSENRRHEPFLITSPLPGFERHLADFGRELPGEQKVRKHHDSPIRFPSGIRQCFRKPRLRHGVEATFEARHVQLSSDSRSERLKIAAGLRVAAAPAHEDHERLFKRNRQAIGQRLAEAGRDKLHEPRMPLKRLGLPQDFDPQRRASLRHGFGDILLGVTGGEEQNRHNDHVPHALLSQLANGLPYRRLGEFEEAGGDLAVRPAASQFGRGCQKACLSLRVAGSVPHEENPWRPARLALLHVFCHNMSVNGLD